jgi:hypothetical protein
VLFDKDALEAAFAEIGQRALAAGRIVDLAVYGGSAIMLTFPARVATKDVDAVVESGGDWLRAVTREIAEDRGWPEDWLNDGVKGFLSDRDREPAARPLFRTYPSELAVGLRVFLPTPRYLFAMKCMAMRIGGADETRDRADIEMLARDLGIATADAAIAIVREFYPDTRISMKTQFGIEEIFGAQRPGGDA